MSHGVLVCLYFPTEIRPATVSAVPRVGETVHLDTDDGHSYWKVGDVEHHVRPGSTAMINVHLVPMAKSE